MGREKRDVGAIPRLEVPCHEVGRHVGSALDGHLLTLTLSAILLLSVSFGAYAQSDNCIDLSDLSAPYIHCTWGNYSNPYLHDGIANGRHTVITQQGTDPKTDGGLQTIPDGERYSVRLGNSRAGGQAESITCDILVDTNDFDLLILKYAAVMENPLHEPEEQPRFKFDILNMQDEPIDPDCLSADFVADYALGWNGNYHLLWKDWTSVGADISNYHGDTIRVRLTTYDCAATGHFGYAYFVLSCGEKN